MNSTKVAGQKTRRAPKAHNPHMEMERSVRILAPRLMRKLRITRSEAILRICKAGPEGRQKMFEEIGTALSRRWSAERKRADRIERHAYLRDDNDLIYMKREGAA